MKNRFLASAATCDRIAHAAEETARHYREHAAATRLAAEKLTSPKYRRQMFALAGASTRRANQRAKDAKKERENAAFYRRMAALEAEAAGAITRPKEDAR